MGYTTKYTNFDDWLDGCFDAGFAISDIKEDHFEYWFEVAGYKMAYWDREQKFGYVSFED